MDVSIARWHAASPRPSGVNCQNIRLGADAAWGDDTMKFCLGAMVSKSMLQVPGSNMKFSDLT